MRFLARQTTLDTMKLRVRGNSIRLRLTQTEVATLLATGAVEECLNFPTGEALRYRLERATAADTAARLCDGKIVIRFPAAIVDRWGQSAEVSMQAEQPLGGGESLRLLVEKDFRCLSPRDDEDDADLFPNPAD